MGMVRIALALAVVLSHMPMATTKIIGGGLAVQCFFIVSGFYMAVILREKYRDLGLFYSNRLLRLYPTYAVMCAVSAIALFAFGVSGTATRELMATAYANPQTAIALIASHITMLGQELLFWFTLDPNGALVLDATGAVPTETVSLAWQGLLIPQSWSLSMELLFYAMAPFLARLGWRALLGVLALGIAIRFSGYLLDVNYPLWQGRFFPAALFLFVLGMLAERVLPLAARLPRWIGFALAPVVLILLAAWPLLPVTGEPSRWLAYALIAATAPFLFHAFATVKLDRWIGELSYPMYLSHILIVAIMLTWAPAIAPWATVALTLALAFAAAAALYILIDRPVDRWRQARLARAKQTPQPAGEPAAA